MIDGQKTCKKVQVPNLISLLVQLGFGLLFKRPDVCHGHPVPLVHPTEHLGRSVKFWYQTFSCIYLSMKVCEYSLFSALDEVLYFVLQPPPKSRTNVLPGPVWPQGDGVHQGGQQHQGLPDLLCYFSPLELHGNQLVGGHYWFSIIPPRFPTNKGVK